MSASLAILCMTAPERMKPRFVYHKVEEFVHFIQPNKQSTLQALRYFVDELPDTISQAVIIQDTLLLHNDFHALLEKIIHSRNAGAASGFILLSCVVPFEQFFKPTTQWIEDNLYQLDTKSLINQTSLMCLIGRDVAKEYLTKLQGQESLTFIDLIKQSSGVYVSLPLFGMSENILALPSTQQLLLSPNAADTNLALRQDKLKQWSKHCIIKDTETSWFTQWDLFNYLAGDKFILEAAMAAAENLKSKESIDKDEIKRKKKKKPIKKQTASENPIELELEKLNQPNADRFHIQGSIVCLTCILKNESAIIERLLNSTLGKIDCLAICDTGSTDNMVQLIKEWQIKNSIPGFIYLDSKFKNFGYNRSISLNNGRKTVTALGYNILNCYWLCLDGDMVLMDAGENEQEEDEEEETKDKTDAEKTDREHKQEQDHKQLFNKRALTEDAYCLRQMEWNLDYSNLRLMCMRRKWKCVGPTHEVYTVLDNLPVVQNEFDLLYIDDRSDGGCKADKFERDIKLLEDDLKENPHSERSWFYLSESYKNSSREGKLKDALRCYRKRVEYYGYDEERWYAKYQIGGLLSTMYQQEKEELEQRYKDWEKGNRKSKEPNRTPVKVTEAQVVLAFLEAFCYRNHRAEPLNSLARFYRLSGQNDKCCMYAMYASLIPYPENDRLFIEPSVYHYEVVEHITICGAYCTETVRMRARFLCNRLIYREVVPDYVRYHTLKMLWFYTTPLPDSASLPSILPSIFKNYLETSRQNFPSAQPNTAKDLQSCTWSFKNSSIVSTSNRNGYVQLISMVNYQINHLGQYVGIDYSKPNQYVYSRNFIVWWSNDLQTVYKWIEIADRTNRFVWNHNIRGLEDARLVAGRLIHPWSEHDVRLQTEFIYFTCTVLDTNVKREAEMCICKMNYNGEILDLHPLVEKGVARCASTQKNWLPFVYEVHEEPKRDDSEQKETSEQKEDDEQSIDKEESLGVHEEECHDSEQKVIDEQSMIDSMKQKKEELDDSKENSVKLEITTSDSLSSIALFHSYDPLKILRCSLNDWNLATTFDSIVDQGYQVLSCPVDIEHEIDSDYIFDTFRGSTAPLPYGKDCFLMIVHEVIDPDGTQNTSPKRRYMHRFLILDQELAPVAYSLDFVLQNKEQIEYIAGACWSNDQKSLIVSYSIEDNKSSFGIIPIATIQRILLSLQSIIVNAVL